MAASGASLRPGSAGNGEYRGPGQWRIDFSLGKNFAVTERTQLQIRFDSFNVTNHTNYVGLSSNINAANFGRLTSSRGARVIQLNAHLRF